MKLKQYYPLAFLLTLCGVIWGASPVFGLSSSITPPVDTDTAWNVCQGYNNSRGSHQGANAYALDLTKLPCDMTPTSNNASAGANTVAPLAGKVYWYDSSAGALCVNTNDSRSYVLVHIDSSLTRGASVAEGQSVGRISTAGTKNNGGVAHLHIQMWAAPNCYNSKPIPFDSTNNARICGAPNMPAAGPDYTRNGTWSGTQFTARSCSYIEQKSAGSIYRFWSGAYNHHFYTANYAEAQHIADTWPDVWKYEGVDFSATPQTAGQCPSSTSQIYRFWSNQYNGHFYTASVAEKDNVIKTWPDTWTYEGVAYCAALTPTADLPVPLHRFWSDEYSGHFYTASVAEKDNVVKTWPDIWKYEGVAYYVGR